MKHLSILVPAGDAVVGSIEGPHKVFNMVNDFMRSMGKPPVFQVELVGLSKEATFNDGLFTLHAHRTVKEDFKTDLIIIPAPHGDMQESIALNQEFLPWINRQYAGGAEVASLCMGAFLLAATGLLSGKKCATHWIASGYFKQMFPEVNLVAEKIIVDEQGIYSSGGAYSYLTLVLYLIEKYAGKDTAVYCAKVFQVDYSRGSQSPFIIFEGQKRHEDEPVKKAQEFIEANFHDKISVDSLASLSYLGRRNFERRFKKATSNTVVEYIQRVKIEAAKKSLESGNKTIYELTDEVGYSDPKAFRTLFKKITGLSPMAYRNKYNREPLVME